MKILVVLLSIFLITVCTTTLKYPKTKNFLNYEAQNTVNKYSKNERR